MRAWLVLAAAGCCHWQQTQLYFGLNRPGGTVSAAEWQKFVDEDVSRLLPDGFTVVDGQGQWRDPAGAVTREVSHVLLVVHPATRAWDGALEELRRVYLKRFDQKSVLRADVPSAVWFGEKNRR
jgi:Protein of unknown function (DUF3574)